MMDRRDVLTVLGSGLVLGLTACTGDAQPAHARSSSTKPTPTLTTSSPTPTTPPVAPTYHQAVIPHGMISTVPAQGNQVAITLDDGVRTDVIEGYAELAKRTGIRLTMFANGCYDSWRAARPVLRPLVDSGQVVIGNHTFNHKALTSLSRSQIAWQLNHNDAVLRSLYGVSTKPYVRPPYGYTNARVNGTLRDLGYRANCSWFGTLGDEQNISTNEIMRNARTYLEPGRVVIGHLNHPGVLHAFDALERLVAERHLTTVTMADVYGAQR